MKLLRRRDFGLLFWGQTASLAGDAPAALATAFAVLEIGGSPAALGVVLVARYLPLALLLLLGGVLADRFSRRFLLITSDVVRMLVQAVLALALFAGAAPLWLFIVVQVVYGGAEALFRPSLAGYLPELVPSDSLREANALVAMSTNMLRIAGPGLGAVMIAWWGSGALLALDAVTFGISALLLAGIRHRPSLVSVVHERLWLALRTGWREVRVRTWLWASILNFTVFGAISVPAVLVLGPEVARLSLGGPDGWAVIMATFAAGALAGSFAAMRFAVSRPVAVCAVLLTVAAFRPAVLVSGLGLVVLGGYSFCAGAAVSMTFVYWRTVLQQWVPEAALSRISSIDDFGTMLLTPVGYLCAGPLAAAIGLSQAMWLLAVVPVLACFATLAVPDVRAMRSSTHAPSVVP